MSEVKPVKGKLPRKVTQISVGLHKGHKSKPYKMLRERPVRKKGKLNKHVKQVRDLIREVTGFSPYEKRCQELLKIQKDKRAYKFLKARLGTHKRAKRKREEMGQIIREARKAQQLQQQQKEREEHKS